MIQGCHFQCFNPGIFITIDVILFNKNIKLVKLGILPHLLLLYNNTNNLLKKKHKFV